MGKHAGSSSMLSWVSEVGCIGLYVLSGMDGSAITAMADKVFPLLRLCGVAKAIRGSCIGRVFWFQG